MAAVRYRGHVPAPLSAAELGAWVAFIQAASRSLDHLDRDLVVKHDLSLADYEILAFLSEAPDRRLKMTDLAQKALVSKSRLTYRVDRLEAKGFVARKRCEDDARRVWATLTPAGLRALKKAWPDHLAGVRRVVIDPVAPRDLAPVQRALEAMIEALDHSEAEACNGRSDASLSA